jgi:hypothetical protein
LINSSPAWPTICAPRSVGLTEAAAEEKRLKMKVQISDMEYWFSTRTYAETKAWAKVSRTRQATGSAEKVGKAKTKF